jgi:hypothetical protein
LLLDVTLDGSSGTGQPMAPEIREQEQQQAESRDDPCQQKAS